MAFVGCQNNETVAPDVTTTEAPEVTKALETTVTETPEPTEVPTSTSTETPLPTMFPVMQWEPIASELDGDTLVISGKSGQG